MNMYYLSFHGTHRGAPDSSLVGVLRSPSDLLGCHDENPNDDDRMRMMELPPILRMPFDAKDTVATWQPPQGASDSLHDKCVGLSGDPRDHSHGNRLPVKGTRVQTDDQLLLQLLSGVAQKGLRQSHRLQS